MCMDNILKTQLLEDMKIVFTPVEYPLTQLLQNVLLESLPNIVIGKQLRRHSSYVIERL